MAIKTEMAQLEVTHQGQMRLLREELRLELVSREAFSSRTADRFRLLRARDLGGSAAGRVFERATAGALSVNASIQALCHLDNHMNTVSIPVAEEAAERGILK